MPPFAYPVTCHAPGCTAPARYKIAAAWSDGLTRELKTYSLACEACLAAEFAKAVPRRDACRLADGETLGPPEVLAYPGGE